MNYITVYNAMRKCAEELDAEKAAQQAAKEYPYEPQRKRLSRRERHELQENEHLKKDSPVLEAWKDARDIAGEVYNDTRIGIGNALRSVREGAGKAVESVKGMFNGNGKKD